MKTLAAVVATAVVATLAAAFHCRMDPNAASDACGLPYQLSNFQAMYPCDPAVLVGRPKNVTEVQAMVRAFPRAQGVGVGHSWWPDPFCAGDGPNAVGIVTTEFTNLEPFYGTGPGGGDRPAVEVDEAALTVEVEAGLTQASAGARVAQNQRASPARVVTPVYRCRLPRRGSSSSTWHPSSRATPPTATPSTPSAGSSTRRSAARSPPAPTGRPSSEHACPMP